MKIPKLMLVKFQKGSYNGWTEFPISGTKLSAGSIGEARIGFNLSNN